MADHERVLIIPRWAADLAKEELGREMHASEIPPYGFWDRIEIAEPVNLDEPFVLPDGRIWP